MASKKTNITDVNLAEVIIDFFQTHNTKTFNYKQVSAEIGATTAIMRADVAEQLEILTENGYLTEVSPGKYKSKGGLNAMVATGRFVRRSNGKNSVIIEHDGVEEAIFVAERNSRHALNGDLVRVNISANRKGHDNEAEVLEIIEQKEQVFIGTFHAKKYYNYISTDSKFLATDIFIPKGTEKDATEGSKVVVKIIEWKEDANIPTGEIVDVLGTAGENNAEIHAILAEFGLPYKYPEEVERAADKIDAGITKEEIAKRRDMRSVPTFTIDPHDAKDFDDALSYRRLPDGNIEVGVHIADVTHYVTPKSIINDEAKERATSVYLVDRTIPMLPERLCNGICSLRPNEEKLTFSCIFTMDDNANILNSEICRTVILSDRRFSYEEAQEIIETGHGDMEEEILSLDRLAKILRKKRFEEGAVDFDRYEVRFNIDETGRPISVYFKESKDANKLVEEFMLLANRTVAEFVGKVKKPRKPKAFVYRVHDTPDLEKMENMKKIALTFGHKVKTEGSAKTVNSSLNAMLQEIKGKGEENLLSALAVRCMAKAVYTTANIGHYGLAFDHYTHFTSPIRRYPDMMVHRLLARYLEGGRSVNQNDLEEECKHSSDMEQLAANAERASIRYKQVEFLGERLGEVYDGVISGVTEWGIYVEVNENKCEGMVPVRELNDDFYDYDEKNYCLTGQRTHKRYQLGDNIRIQVARADLIKKQLDFVVVDENHPANPKLKEGKMITYNFEVAKANKLDQRPAGRNRKGKGDKKKENKIKSKNKGKHWSANSKKKDKKRK